ncbi:MAG: hypothetical protein HEQ19_27815 [Gloeotrichia echinulata CP02]|jgi:hypothetical protein
MTSIPNNAATPSPQDPPSDYIIDIIRKAKDTYTLPKILLVPSHINQNDVQNLQDISLIDTYASVYSAAYIYPSHPHHFDITTPDKVASFTTVLASGYFRVITEGLPTFLSMETSTALNFSAITTTGELNIKLRHELFQSFQLSHSATRQLDSIMENIVRRLEGIRAVHSPQLDPLNYLLSVYSFEQHLLIPAMRFPKIHLFYLKIDQNSFNTSVSNSSANSFTFKMNYQIYKLSINSSHISTNIRDLIKTYITKMTNQTFDSIQHLVAMNAINPS